jgi:hypothetical protein
VRPSPLRLAPLLIVVLAGCGPPPEPPATPGPLPPPATGTASPGPTFPGQPPGTGPALPSGGFGDQIAVDCNGEPGDDELLSLLVAEDLLGAGSDAEVVNGPLCAGDWQYAVVSVPDLDPLQVVSSGEPGDLELVAAGTEVCTPEVRIQAPPGIRAAAACGA